MNRERCFSFLRGQRLAVAIGGESALQFPLTYTLEEAFEDWCDEKGVGFVKVLGCYPDRNVSGLGSGKFLYKLPNKHRSLHARRTKRQLYADFYGGVGDETSW